MSFEKLNPDYKAFSLNQCKNESSDAHADFQNHDLHWIKLKQKK